MGRPCDWSCRDHHPYPPFARGGKGRNEIGMKVQLVQDQLFTSPASHWAGGKLVSTVLEGRFRGECFCCARSNDGAGDRSFPPLAKGGPGGVGREPWKSKTTLPASR
jgi:hypothetical protein